MYGYSYIISFDFYTSMYIVQILKIVEQENQQLRSAILLSAW